MGQSSMEEYFPSMCTVLYSSIITTKQTKKRSYHWLWNHDCKLYYNFVLEKEGYTEIAWGWNQSDPLPCLDNQRRQDSFMSTPVTSDTAPSFQKPMNCQKRKRLGKVKTGVYDPRCYCPGPQMHEGGSSMATEPSPTLFPSYPESASTVAWQGVSWWARRSPLVYSLQLCQTEDQRGQLSLLRHRAIRMTHEKRCQRIVFA